MFLPLVLGLLAFTDHSQGTVTFMIKLLFEVNSYLQNLLGDFDVLFLVFKGFDEPEHSLVVSTLTDGL